MDFGLLKLLCELKYITMLFFSNKHTRNGTQRGNDDDNDDPTRDFKIFIRKSASSKKDARSYTPLFPFRSLSARNLTVVDWQRKKSVVERIKWNEI